MAGQSYSDTSPYIVDLYSLDPGSHSVVSLVAYVEAQRK